MEIGDQFSLCLRKPNLTLLDEQEETQTLKVIGWFSVGMAVAAVGLFVGRELRSAINSRTHTLRLLLQCRQSQSTEFGIGI